MASDRDADLMTVDLHCVLPVHRAGDRSEMQHASERLAPPVAQVFDPRVDQLGGGLL